MEMNLTQEQLDKAMQKKLKKEKKRLKKEKRQAAEPEGEDLASKKRPVDETAEKVKKPKKSKKSKTSETRSTTSSTSPYAQPPPKDGSFTKAFYTEHPETAKITTDELQKFHEANAITMSGNECLYRPILGFQHTNFPSNMLACVANFSAPTPIQSQCWPILTSGRDIIGIAETGSGKTLAFTLPGMVHLLSKPNRSTRPSMLVIAPTRELAMQSSQVISDTGKTCNVASLCIYGGVAKRDQRQALKRGVQVVVATPGRLRDLMEEGACDLSGITYMVLDEADRMLDEGFERDIRSIIAACHPERQIAMFSATWPQSIQALAHEFLADPVKVTIGSDDLAASVNVTQIVEVVDAFGRDRLIQNLLTKYHDGKNRVLVFVLYKKEASRVEHMIRNQGWNAIAIHGDLAQNQRIEAMEKFKSGKVPLLIATDVAARGLDIPDVEFVLNYSFPLTIEDYVHRIGRTGRGGKKGTAHTFFTSNDKARAGELVNLLRDSEQPIPKDLMQFGTHVKKKEHKLYGAFAKNIDMTKKATKITFDD